MDHRRAVLGLTATALGAALKNAVRPSAAAATAVAPAKPGSVDGRTAHWVIRCTDLQPFLEFASKCFGMRVIRHEENSQPCDITCNVSAQRASLSAARSYR